MKKPIRQQELLRAARTRLNTTTEDLARRLGKSPAAVNAWLARDSAPMHRTMPKSARLLLAAILAQHRAAKKK